MTKSGLAAKRTILALATMLLVPSTGNALPQYDIEKACSEAAAIAIKDGADAMGAMAMASFCGTLSERAKSVAEPLWEMTDKMKREECASKTEAEARERGLSEGWYPALLECMRGETGKADRLRTGN